MESQIILFFDIIFVMILRQYQLLQLNWQRKKVPQVKNKVKYQYQLPVSYNLFDRFSYVRMNDVLYYHLTCCTSRKIMQYLSFLCFIRYAFKTDMKQLMSRYLQYYSNNYPVGFVIRTLEIVKIIAKVGL